MNIKIMLRNNEYSLENKRNKLRWFGNVEKRNNDKIVKKIDKISVEVVEGVGQR